MKNTKGVFLLESSLKVRLLIRIIIKKDNIMENLSVEIVKELLLSGKSLEIKETKEGYIFSVVETKKKKKAKKKRVKNTHLTIDQVVNSGLFSKVNYWDLKRFCLNYGYEIIKVPCSEYKEVNAYPIESWIMLYNITKKDLENFNLWYK